MTSVEDYRRNLRAIVNKYRPYSILELGVEKGKSTKVFLEFPVELLAVDLVKDKDLVKDLKDKKWEYLITDARKFLKEDVRTWDMVYMDLTYYEQEGLEYGTKEAHAHCIKCWEEDIREAYSRVNQGGVLVVNDYINQVSYRPYPQVAVNALAIELGKSFEVYPARGGTAVIQK